MNEKITQLVQLAIRRAKRMDKNHPRFCLNCERGRVKIGEDGKVIRDKDNHVEFEESKQVKLVMEEQHCWYKCPECKNVEAIAKTIVQLWKKCPHCKERQLVFPDEIRNESPHTCTFCKKDFDVTFVISCSDPACRCEQRVPYSVITPEIKTEDGKIVDINPKDRHTCEDCGELIVLRTLTQYLDHDRKDYIIDYIGKKLK